MPKSKAIINIQNVVASATLNQKVDLNAVVKSYPGVGYRPEQFPGLVEILRLPPKTPMGVVRAALFLRARAEPASCGIASAFLVEEKSANISIFT